MIALLEVSVGKKKTPNYFVKNAKLMYKWHRNYILNIFKSLILLLAFHEK